MAIGAVGHPARGHVAHAAVEGIGVGARFGVGLVDLLTVVVASAPGLAVHLQGGRRGKLQSGL